MKLTRGEFVGTAATALGAGALSGCTELVRQAAPPAIPRRLDPEDVDPVIWRALNRMAFGPIPGEAARVKAIGLDAYIAEQLAPEGLNESLECRLRLGTLDTLEMDAADARDREMAILPDVGRGQAAQELRQACLIRAVYSRRQLYEVMVDFWTNHFNVSQLKRDCSWLKTVDDRRIRRHALGKFHDLVIASARSAAMLFYLDNHRNRRRDSETGSAPNENYARELLELHTLGVDGGYTLRDIQEVARCFTGWSYKEGLEWQPGEFIFRSELHDDWPKKVLGVTLPAGQGLGDGEQVIRLLCRHPSTARHIARKLARRFVADRGDAELEARLARVFRDADGEIRPVLSALFHSPEFRQGGEKMKRPLDFVVSALRILGANTTGAGVLRSLEWMGQLPYHWPMPDGYPDRVGAWAPGLLWRWNFALDLVEGRIPETTVPAGALARAAGTGDAVVVVRSLSRLVLGEALAEPAARRLVALSGDGVDLPIRQWLALLLCAPRFQWR